MKPITFNKSNTVGICDGTNSKSDFIGYFESKLLLEWVHKLVETYGEIPVYLYSHRSSDKDNTARLLTATELPCDEIQVCVAGLEYDNDKDHY